MRIDLEPRWCCLYPETIFREELSATGLEGECGGGNFLLKLLIPAVEIPDKLLRAVFQHRAWEETVASKVNMG